LPALAAAAPVPTCQFECPQNPRFVLRRQRASRDRIQTAQVSVKRRESRFGEPSRKGLSRRSQLRFFEQAVEALA
jgi:hypothetical protein